MTTEILRKLVWREKVASGELVQLLASHESLVKLLTADYVAHNASCSDGEELSLLVTNLLSRDCGDANPGVAGGCVAALAALPPAADLALTAISNALDSPHARVRRSGSAACVRYSLTQCGTAAQSGLSDLLYAKLRDTDPIVVANCLHALDAVLAAEGGMVVNRAIALHLLARLQDMTQTPSSLETVLHVLQKYSPKDDKERFLLLNPLDQCFNTDHAGVLIAAVQLFLHWTAPHPKLNVDLMKVIQPTFCRILINSSSETCFLLIEFLTSMGESIRETFNPHYRYFSLNPDDPNFLKEAKLDILGLIALPENVSEFIAEMKLYCSDYNSYGHAIRCLGVLGTVSGTARQQVYNILPELLEASSDKIVAVALECLLTLSSGQSCNVSFDKDDTSIVTIAVTSNKTTASVLTQLGKDVSSDIDQQSHAATAQMSSKSGAPNDDEHLCFPSSLLQSLSRALSSPTLTEKHPRLLLHVFSRLCPVVECCIPCLELLQARHSSLSPGTQRLLLTTTVRVFLWRPAQCYVILCRALRAALRAQDSSVRAHAAMIYAALQYGPTRAADVLR